VGAGNWQVDTANADKVLTVHTAQATPAQVMKAVQDAGFEIQPLA